MRQDSVECLGLKPDWLTYRMLLVSKKDAVCKWITFSNVLDKIGRREIGRYFFGSVLDPFLYKAFNLAIPQGSGNVEEMMERFIN